MAIKKTFSFFKDWDSLWKLFTTSLVLKVVDMKEFFLVFWKNFLCQEKSMNTLRMIGSSIFCSKFWKNRMLWHTFGRAVFFWKLWLFITKNSIPVRYDYCLLFAKLHPLASPSLWGQKWGLGNAKRKAIVKSGR